MTNVQIIVISGIALGVVQVLAGVALGVWIGRRRPQADAAGISPDAERAERLAADLQGLTATVTTSVQRHNATIESIDERLRAETEGVESVDLGSPLTSLVVGIVGEMLDANRRLQGELHSAEAALERQSRDLIEHRHQAMTDGLTGLPNRRSLESHLGSLVEGWRKHGTPFSVMLLDIDHFKRFNDTHGHQTGDATLKAFAQAVARVVRKHDLVARYGGEEFAVLLPHTTLTEAAPAVRKIRRAIADLQIVVECSDEPIPVTASGGLATIGAHEPGNKVIGRADEALYAAKHDGRDRVFQHTGDAIELLETDLGDGDSAPTITLAEGVREACADLRAGLDRFMEEPNEPPSVVGS